MELVSFKLRRLRIPFKVAFKHSLNESKEVSSVILEVKTRKGSVGYGECVPRSYVTGETVDSVVAELESVLPALMGKTFETPSDFTFANVKGLCTHAALELACLDALGKDLETNVIHLLGGPQVKAIRYSGVISAGKPEVIELMAQKFHQLGLRQIKLKVGGDIQQDLDHVAIVHKTFGPGLELRVDANAAWNLAEAKANLLMLAKNGVVSCEQPMPRGADYAELFRVVKGKLRLSLDENLCSFQDGLRAVTNLEGDVFNLRVSKNGGIVQAFKLHQLAKVHGLDTQLGAQVGETSILSAAGRILALLAGNMLFHEGSFGLFLLESDVTDDVIQFGKGGEGSLEFLNRPGLGVDVIPEKLDELTYSP